MKLTGLLTSCRCLSNNRTLVAIQQARRPALHSSWRGGNGSEDALAWIEIGAAWGGLEFNGADHVCGSVEAARVGELGAFDEAGGDARVRAGRTRSTIDMIADHGVRR